MKKYLQYFKNKYILTSTIFVLYALFLDDNDIFSIISFKRKLNRIEDTKELVSSNLNKTRSTLKKLKYTAELERFAREEKFFKKDNEDIFVISYEK